MVVKQPIVWDMMVVFIKATVDRLMSESTCNNHIKEYLKKRSTDCIQNLVNLKFNKNIQYYELDNFYYLIELIPIPQSLEKSQLKQLTLFDIYIFEPLINKQDVSITFIEIALDKFSNIYELLYKFNDNISINEILIFINKIANQRLLKKINDSWFCLKSLLQILIIGDGNKATDTIFGNNIDVWLDNLLQLRKHYDDEDKDNVGDDEINMLYYLIGKILTNYKRYNVAIDQKYNLNQILSKSIDAIFFQVNKDIGICYFIEMLYSIDKNIVLIDDYVKKLIDVFDRICQNWDKQAPQKLLMLKQPIVGFIKSNTAAINQTTVSFPF